MQPSMKLTTKEAAKYLRVGVSTLARWRDEGRGPAFITYFGDRGGRTIRYELWALDAFVAKNRKEPRGPKVQIHAPLPMPPVSHQGNRRLFLYHPCSIGCAR